MTDQALIRARDEQSGTREMWELIAGDVGRRRWLMLGLVYNGGLTQAEVATRLDLSPATVRREIASSLRQVCTLVGGDR